MVNFNSCARQSTFMMFVFLVQLLCSPTKMWWEHMAECDVDQEELLIFAAGLDQCPLLLLLTLSPEN